MTGGDAARIGVLTGHEAERFPEQGLTDETRPERAILAPRQPRPGAIRRARITADLTQEELCGPPASAPALSNS